MKTPDFVQLSPVDHLPTEPDAADNPSSDSESDSQLPATQPDEPVESETESPCCGPDSGAASLYADELHEIHSLVPPSQADIDQRMLFLGEKKHRFTLVLDLDRTLVFSSPVATGGQCQEPAFQFDVKIRPYAKELLEKMSKKYELVVFTAAEESYARAILQLLDPTSTLISGLAAQSQCVLLPSGHWVKDLRVFADRCVDEMIIADDNVFSFAFNLDNGIPVAEFRGDMGDDELTFLIDYLDEIADSKNIVKTNKKRINLSAGCLK